MHKMGFVVGNGKSRLKYDLSILRQHGLLYGCNALFRDFEPDLLVSVDSSMIDEILNSGYKGEVLYIGKGSRGFFLNRTHPENKQGMKNHVILSRGWAAGPSSAWLMCQYYPTIKVINLIGFDLYGTEGKINNIYAGTDNYQPKASNAVVPRSWINHLAILFKENPGVTFCRVGNVTDKFPEQWEDCTNIHFVSEWIYEVTKDNTYLSGEYNVSV